MQYLLDQKQEAMETNVMNSMVDLSYLKKLSKGNTRFMKEMIGIFRQQVTDSLRQMDEALNRRDWSVIRNVAHKLKAGYNTIGMKMLGQQAAELENKASDGSDTGRIEELVRSLRELTQAGLKELHEEEMKLV